MYKQRISQWGVDKNSKESEMRAIVQKQLDRSQRGKASSFTVRGQQIEYSDVLRYWDRKNVQTEAVALQRAASKTPEAVRCFTPIPSPVGVPADFALPEHILVSLRNYHVDSFESGTWQDQGPFLHCQTTKVRHSTQDPLDIMSRNCSLACDLFSRGYCREAGRSLRVAMAVVKDLVIVEEPGTFVEILGLLCSICIYGYQEIALSLLQQISAMGALLLGHEHPFRSICQWLLFLCQNHDQSYFGDLLGSLFKVVSDTFEAMLGAMHLSTLRSRLKPFEFISSSDGAQLQRLVYDCENTLGPQDPRTIEATLYWGAYHWQISDNNKAKEIIQAIWFRVRGLFDQNSPFCTWALQTLARSQYMTGDIHMAIRSLQDVIILLLSNGSAYSGVQEPMILLEQYLTEQGDLDQAARVREMWTNILAQLDPD